MASHLGADNDPETDGSTDPDQTGLGPSLEQLKSEQARLLEQLSSSDMSEVAINDESSESYGATASSTSPDEQTTSNKATPIDDMTVSQSAVSMPGLQPFAKGKNSLPCSWSDCTLSGDVPFCQVMLNKQSWEFQSILAEFTIAGLTVKKIERIENRDLWEKFEFEKGRMLKNHTEVNEVYLFHGTVADKEQICHEGLDQRLSRIGYFGRGIYFSNDPRKCVSYTQGDKTGSQSLQQSMCMVYKCRSLLGNMKVYPPGQHAKDLRREPEVENPEPGGPKYYDSVQGRVKEFDEFILYKSERVMPEYVISCYMPLTSLEEKKTPQATVTLSTRPKDGTAQEDLYGGLSEEEIHAELAAGVLRQPARNASRQEYEGLAEEEVSAELAAGALGPSMGSVLTADREEEDEMSMELRAKGGGPHPAGGPVEDSHPEIHDKQGNVYEQLHQKEILDAIRARQRQEQEQMQSFLEFERRQQEEGTEGWKDSTVVVNQLKDEVSQEIITVGDGIDATDIGQQVRSRMPKDHLVSQTPVTLPKSASMSRLEAGRSGQSDIIVNQLEPRRHKLEVIAPEFLPVVLEVRERVQKARQKEREMEMDRTRSASSNERKTPRWQQEAEESAWTPKEYAEQQKLLAKVREKVQADRKAEELEKQEKKMRGGRSARETTVTDNSLSSEWKEDGSDGVRQVLDVLIVQFMDVTACDDIVEARNCILQANMDVNKAVISYISG